MIPRPPSVAALTETIESIVSLGINDCSQCPPLFSLPAIDLATARDACSLVSSQFALEPTLLELTGDFTIIGDLLGHVFDFIRILAKFGMPPGTRYILLGNLVDHGAFSLHTAIYAFALKCTFPNDFYIIRGSHEFRDVNSTAGLLAETQALFHCPDIFDAMNVAFSLTPLGIRLNGDILCIHAGLGPDLATVDQIADIERPFTTSENPIVEAIVWSDPNHTVSMERPAGRQGGYEFGAEPLASFLTENRLRLIVRGHERIAEGVRWQLGGRIVTVFSVSLFCGRIPGQCGVLRVSPGMPEREERLSAQTDRHRSANSPTRSAMQPPITFLKARANRARELPLKVSNV
jgi:diadenosine tetraphosphatase ApaH/serine/threonine PP2A family protein phosphatase